MEEEAEQIRRLVRTRPGLRYPRELRARIEQYVRRRRADGASQNAVSKEVGVKWSTLRRWDVEVTTRSAGMVPVRITAEPAPTPSPLSLVTPSGYRLEGLDARDAVALFRVL